MKRGMAYLLACAVVALDQLTKVLIITFLPYTTNTGAAFGLFPSSAFILSLISVVVVIVLLIAIQKYPYPELAMLLGGTTGNLIDRILRGHVIDFINVGWWPSFNVADALNTLAVVFLIIRAWKKD